MNLLDVLDAWELLREDVDLSSYSMIDWKKIEEALVRVEPGKPALGAVHLGLTDGIAASEGADPFSGIAPYALTFETVWLPDPMYSFLTHDAAKAFRLLPESKGTFFDEKPGAQLDWRNLWMANPQDRRAHARAQLPAILQRLQELRPLVELGAVRFFRWEPLLHKQRDALRKVAIGLSTDSDVKKLTERVPQIEYALGARAGRIGIQASNDFTGPGNHPKKGDELHFANKLPMVLSALLNTSVSTTLSSSFAPAKRGDRMLYDCFVSGGRVDAQPTTLVPDLRLPRFAEAVQADLVAIRRDSETLRVFREALRDAGGVTESAALPAIEDRLRQAAAKLYEDASLRKAVGDKSVDGTIASLVTGVATYAFEHAADVKEGGLAAVIAAVAFLATLLPPVIRGSGERAARRERAELVVRVADRL